jgi:hypothetical protein
MRLETAWMVIPLLLAMAMFGWGAKLDACSGYSGNCDCTA